tara:strand:+ start:757 stop:2010 length:1254 start_codon:yes stop_codon:yes gene_type:complete
MTYEISIGERKSLVFPVMCHGHLRIDYSDEVAGNNYGIFGHDDSFTIQAILTPYDINGFGFELTGSDNPDGKMGVLTSKKTPPALQSKIFSIHASGGSSSLDFSSVASSNRIKSETGSYFDSPVTGDYQKTSGYEMMLFYNSNVQLSLIESTTTNVNQPSEYKVKLTIVSDGVSDSLTTTNPVIVSNNITSDSTRWKGTAITYGYDSGGSGAAYEQIGTLTGSSSTGSTDVNQEITGVINTNVLFSEDMKLYKRSGQTFTHAATVATTAANQTFTVDSSHSLENNDVLYIEAYKEALYLVTPYHIGASYDTVSGNMAICVNGSLIQSKVHSNYGESFEIAAEDCFIGSDNLAGQNTFSNTDSSTQDGDWASSRCQFMGELHEFSITKGAQITFMNVDTLIPNYRQTLLYYRFEEVDL